MKNERAAAPSVRAVQVDSAHVTIVLDAYRRVPGGRADLGALVSSVSHAKADIAVSRPPHQREATHSTLSPACLFWPVRQMTTIEPRSWAVQFRDEQYLLYGNCLWSKHLDHLSL